MKKAVPTRGHKEAPLDYKVVSVASLDHVQRGGIESLAAIIDKADQETLQSFVDNKAECLTLVYAGGNGKLERLEWLVPDKQEYELLVNCLDDFLNLQKQEQGRYTGDLRFLQFHCACTLEKRWGTAVTAQEWNNVLADKLQSPLKKHVLQSKFRQCAVDDKLSLAAVAILLQDIQEEGLELTGRRAAHADPLELLWTKLLETDPVPVVGVEDDEQSLELGILRQEETISPVAFLSFVRSYQKEYTTTLEHVVDLVNLLNRQAIPEDLLSQAVKAANNADISQQGRLNKTRFRSYLTSDTNDIVDPTHAKIGADDMAHPLSHYWIHSSHDTYLAGTVDSFHDKSALFTRFKSGPEQLDEKMYYAALLRGVRCLEMDVWDSVDGKHEPVVCRRDPLDGAVAGLALVQVLHQIRNFLLQHPYSFPVILKLENHCSPTTQLRMAKYIFFCLQSDGLVAIPNKNVDFNAATLPSPVTMLGKVVLMGKRPKVLREGAFVVHDDFDDQNDIWQKAEAVRSNFWEDDDDDDADFQINNDNGIIVGFDLKGPVRSKALKAFVRTPTELLAISDRESTEANQAAASAVKQAAQFEYEGESQEALLIELMQKAGMTLEEVRRRAARDEDRVYDPSFDVRYFDEENSTKDEGMEVPEFLPDIVEGSRDSYAEAAQVAMEASQKVSIAAAKLKKAEDELKRTEMDLNMSQQREGGLVEEAKRAAAEARAHREHAESAKVRVETVRELLRSSEGNASSAGTVVVTALTEAKISEKRAADAEARASRALVAADKDRGRADEETRKEEDLEQEISYLHRKYTEAIELAAATRDRVEKAVSMLDRVNDQIKLIECSTQYQKEILERPRWKDNDSQSPRHGGTFIAKHATKLEEREICRELIREASQENSTAEARRNCVQEAFEEKVRLLKMQADLAAQTRKQADRSSHMAEELAEHAEEERDAATLRHIAREKAEATVENRDSHRESVQAQLLQAERASAEAASIAVQSRKRAERLERDATKVKVHHGFNQAHEKKVWERDQARGEYDAAKLEKQRKDAGAVADKRRLDTNSEVYRAAVRDVTLETDRVKVEKIYDQEAIAAYSKALVLRKQKRLAVESSKACHHKADQLTQAARCARDYKERTDMMSETPLALSRITMLHTLKHRSWDKSLSLPSAHVHSFSQNVLLHMVEENFEQQQNILHAFTKKHLCRVFPSWSVLQSKSFTNYDPVLGWAMGCQIVSMNFQSADESLLVADGRFRQNGSCGYVLKPPHLLDSSLKREESQHWTFAVLSGFKLPKPSGGRKSFNINPFVRISLYEGSTKAKRTMYNTKRIKNNGLNPIWREDEVFEFNISNPSIAMVVFSVWDKTDEGTEDFIAAASLPVSCLREGYRSIALFDAKHSRSGPYAFSSLLVKASKRIKIIK